MPIGFAAPAFLWTLLAVPLVIALHFIRKQRKQKRVSASFLWQDAKRMAQKRRRFSLSWLLAAQLAFVTLAGLALARPYWRNDAAVARAFIIDASASMLARDSDGVRLDKALGQAQDLLRRSGQVAVIRAGRDASVWQAPTSNSADVRNALTDLPAGDVSSDLLRAIDLARSLLPEAELHIFSDSSAETTSGAITWHNVGLDAQNIGISAFDLRYQQAFVSVVSNHPRPQEVVLEIYQVNPDTPASDASDASDGQLLVSSSLLVPASGQTNVAFPLTSEQGLYRARLQVPDWDALTLDNEAFSGSRNLTILLRPRSQAVERALRAIPNVEVRFVQRLPASLEPYDIITLIGDVPKTLPPGRYLLFPNAQEEANYETVADWDRSDPLLRFADLSGVVVATAADAFIPSLEWQPLAESQSLLPVIAKTSNLADTTDAAVEAVAFSFHPTQNDMVRRVAFPIVMTNIIERYRSESRLPLGTILPATSSNSGARWVLEPGLYTLDNRLYSASLLDANESRLNVNVITNVNNPAQPALEDTEGVDATNAAVSTTVNNTVSNTVNNSESEQRLEVAYILVVIAFLLLVAEWWLWSRGRTAASAS
jgi:hypothetical protein